MVYKQNNTYVHNKSWKHYCIKGKISTHHCIKSKHVTAEKEDRLRCYIDTLFGIPLPVTPFSAPRFEVSG